MLINLSVAFHNKEEANVARCMHARQLRALSMYRHDDGGASPWMRDRVTPVHSDAGLILIFPQYPRPPVVSVTRSNCQLQKIVPCPAISRCALGHCGHQEDFMMCEPGAKNYSPLNQISTQGRGPVSAVQSETRILFPGNAESCPGGSKMKATGA
ncbi:uncharacterized protein LOC110978346 [Acanthaster planci]|uniref:Uncharacterized protein LOC110978346 n=1 Tax=Acanthaster planci TaxID=133434 RepID=A0A8B7Y8V6_ACAPL|nr:uncharacterized protein LOC110978346 [Acanthaster planci]